LTAFVQQADADGFMLAPDADAVTAQANASTIPSATAAQSPAGKVDGEGL
jgi:hypothetical protein